jgi:hypothetical protein
MANILRKVKNRVVPRGRKYYRLPFGLAAGCTIRLDLANQMMLYLGLYERELNPYFQRLVQPGFRCFDVGGQDGYDALILGKLSGAPILSFECDPLAVQEMRATFSRNQRYEVEVIEAFVSDLDGDSTITLDRAAQQHFLPDFIKMDIEGAEVQALRGATNILYERKPAMIIETHGLEVEAACLSILREHDYKVSFVNQRGWLKESRPVQHNRWLICE